MRKHACPNYKVFIDDRTISKYKFHSVILYLLSFKYLDEASTILVSSIEFKENKYEARRAEESRWSEIFPLLCSRAE